MRDKLEKVLNHIWDKSKFTDKKALEEALEVYAKYFGKKPDLNCSGCMRNMVESLKSLAKNSKFTVSTAAYYDRKDICKKCEHYWKVTDQCGKCKCFLFIKAMLKGSKCPENYW